MIFQDFRQKNVRRVAVRANIGLRARLVIAQQGSSTISGGIPLALAWGCGLAECLAPFWDGILLVCHNNHITILIQVAPLAE